VLAAPLASAVAAHNAKRFAGRRGEARGPQGAPAASTTPMTGVLLRSQIVSGWPSLVVSATQGGAVIPLARRATLAPDVLLCLFAGVPDEVTIAEPYQGLQFGVEDNGIPLRRVTPPDVGHQTGGVVPSDGSYDTLLAQYTRSVTGGVVTVASLASALAAGLQVPAQSFGAGDFALQMVFAPELQPFPSGIARSPAS
jgi:hypothetical protein